MKIKPCAECGSKVNIFVENLGGLPTAYVRCEKCDFQIRVVPDRKIFKHKLKRKAISEWNRRN